MKQALMRRLEKIEEKLRTRQKEEEMLRDPLRPLYLDFLSDAFRNGSNMEHFREWIRENYPNFQFDDPDPTIPLLPLDRRGPEHLRYIERLLSAYKSKPTIKEDKAGK